ncbi:MAG: tRNA (N(6)-L-threonylcarbamoyladenosine(37)-C(2))-methylthiotransferase MtaB [Clostridia bacterium]|nr:tRNA (N(6)-L-threonylcarbamoyladenosine(37)-C(2))-methylthiotransferase MtaB [Clostridia bacterium]
MKKFFIITFGCKVNQYESEYVKEMLEEKNFKNVDDYKDADIVIVNSCTVTAQGDSKVYKFLRRVKRANEDCIVVLSGCLPQAFPNDIDLSNVDIVTGNTEYNNISKMIDEYIKTGEKIVSITPHKKDEKFQKMCIREFSEHTRAFVKIQDGCNNFCSYCIIPYSRGRIRSKSISDIEKELTDLAHNGYKEIVLTGINLSCFGKEENKSLVDAVKIANSIDKIKRIRLGSLEPELLTEAVLKELSEIEKFCPQFHISLQSGCDKTLKRMNRHYTTAEYRKIVKDIRTYFENPAITTDIMVGFAGETEEDFKTSSDFANEIKFSRIHVFPYSKRPGTIACKYEDQVPNDTKVRRAKIMTEQANRLQKEFLINQVGKKARLLVERKAKESSEFSDTKKEVYEGYSENYTFIKVESDKDIVGEIIDVKIISSADRYCIAEIL